MGDLDITLISVVYQDNALANLGFPMEYSKAKEWFDERTLDCPVIMDRQMRESIGGVLPGRLNLVVLDLINNPENESYQPRESFVMPSFADAKLIGKEKDAKSHFYDSLSQALEALREGQPEIKNGQPQRDYERPIDYSRVHIFGGQRLFEKTLRLKQITKIVLAEIDAPLPSKEDYIGTFPKLNKNVWNPTGKHNLSDKVKLVSYGKVGDWGSLVVTPLGY